MAKKRVLFLSTAKFVCAQKIGDAYAPVELTDENLMSFIPELEDYQVDTEIIFVVDSSDIMPSNWVQISNRIKEVYHKYDGIVVYQGIDTLHYTASALSFLILDPALPIVLTSYLVPPYIENTDSKRNIFHSVKVAAESNLNEVTVVFNSLIMRGNRCVKASDLEFTSFFSTIPSIGKFENNEMIIENKTPISKEGQMSFYPNITDKVGAIKMIPGLPPEIIRIYLNLGYKGLIIESFSEGNVPIGERSLLEILKELVENGMVVVLGSQSLHGWCVDYDDPAAIMSSYSRYMALDSGCIPSRDMTTETALTKLMWLLGNFPDDLEHVKKLFLTNLAGEMSEESLSMMKGSED
ncbi:MAG: asparaginase [Nanobdellota archaeon]